MNKDRMGIMNKLNYTKFRNKAALPLFGASMLFVLGSGTKHQIDMNKVKKNLEDYTARRISEFKVDYPHMMGLRKIIESSINKYLSMENPQGAYDVLSLVISGNEWEKYMKMADIKYNGTMPPRADDLTPVQLVKIMEAYFENYYQDISKY